jgi:hypothetical protein
MLHVGRALHLLTCRIQTFSFLKMVKSKEVIADNFEGALLGAAGNRQPTFKSFQQQKSSDRLGSPRCWRWKNLHF